MAHIHMDNGQHDLTVSMFIIRTDFDRPKILLHVHRKLNIWFQFGGHVELNENPWQAVEHELLDETGYELSQLKLLQQKSRLLGLKTAHTTMHPQPAYLDTHPIVTPDLEGKKHYHTDLGYIFVTDQEPIHQLAKDESKDQKLFARDELESLRGNAWDDTIIVCERIFDECLPNWEQVSL